MRLIYGDSLYVVPSLGVGSFDVCITDPPYGLGFLGKTWDHGVPGVPYWSAVRSALKPGSYLLAFGGTRTHHRLMVALEDAGFSLVDCLMWLHGQGFPKGKTQLKPAWEPIILARRPYRAQPLNIDACRIDSGTLVQGGGNGVSRPYGQRDDMVDGVRKINEPHTRGRWPANVVLDEEAAALLDEQSGRLRAGVAVGGKGNAASIYGSPLTKHRGEDQGYADPGGASRFFYTSKASSSERRPYNDHPTVKPLALMRWLVRLVTPPGGIILDPFMGSGSTLVAAALEGFTATGIDNDPHSIEIAQRRIHDSTGLDIEMIDRSKVVIGVRIERRRS